MQLDKSKLKAIIKEAKEIRELYQQIKVGETTYGWVSGKYLEGICCASRGPVEKVVEIYRGTNRDFLFPPCYNPETDNLDYTITRSRYNESLKPRIEFLTIIIDEAEKLLKYGR